MWGHNAKVNIRFEWSAQLSENLSEEEETLYVCGASTMDLYYRETAYVYGFTSTYGETFTSCPDRCRPDYSHPFSCYDYEYYSPCDIVDDRGSMIEFWYDFPTPIFNQDYVLDDPDAGPGTPVDPDVMNCCSINYTHNPALVMPGGYNAHLLNFSDGRVRLAGPAPIWNFPFGSYTQTIQGRSGGTVRDYDTCGGNEYYDDDGNPVAVNRYGECSCCWQNEIDPQPLAKDMPADRGM